MRAVGRLQSYSVTRTSARRLAFVLLIVLVVSHGTDHAATTIVANDVSVDVVSSFGSLAKPFVGPQTIRAVVTNRGTSASSNLPVTLNITGAETFTNAQIIPSLPADGGQATVTFAPFTPVAIGSDTVTVSVPADDVSGNNSLSRPLNETLNLYSYKYPGTTTINAIGIKNQSSMVAKFTTAAAAKISAISVEFTDVSTATYKLVIYPDAGSGTPGLAPIYEDSVNRTVGVAGPVTLVLPSPVAVGPGEFYAGIRGTNSEFVDTSFDHEAPIRSGAFYFSLAFPPTAWSDFAPGNDFKLNIGVTLLQCTTAVDCNDGNPCTDDACANGLCASTVTTTCTDNNPCTIGDTCSGGACVPGTAALPNAVQFCNSGPIAIPSLGASTPYPSSIFATALPSYLCSMSVSLHGLAHTNPSDVDMLLARLAGSNALILSDVGGVTDITGVNLTLADAAASPLPGTLVSGAFKPTNVSSGDSFPAPAPAPTGGSALSIFTGTNPNGTWNLWVTDDLSSGASGSLSGWCVNVVSACGADAECDDANPCTSDTCNGGSCAHANVSNGTSCNDQNACTQTAVCQSGVCTGSSPVADGTLCDDGNTCTLGSSCRSGNCLAPVAFTQAGAPVSVGTSPRSLAVGDFNGDAKLDLAVANNNSGSVTILRGDGAGGFTPFVGSPITAGSLPRSIAVGDWNGDAKLDLVVANQGSANVTILRGDGAGGFSQPTGPFTVGTTPFSVAVGDWDRNGKPDLAVANNGSANVSILLGDGSGGFTQPLGPFTVGSGPNSVAAGDWDGDGKLDLAVSNNGPDNLTILRGDGSGGFTGVGSPIPVGDGPFCVEAGDWNGDGKLDLAVANSNVDNVTILLGDGSGGFAAFGSPVAVGDAPFSLAVSDVNGDGDLDLAVANGNSGDVTILLGTGSGAFTSAGPTVLVGTLPRGVAFGTIDAGGKPDLALANSNANNVTILLNTTTSASDGTACDDGNACTQTDSCQSGSCSGASPVVCSASDDCHVAGTCNPASGACSTPLQADDTACNDGNACTQTDTCQSGSCNGSDPVTCTALNPCRVAGTCSPASGVCSNPNQPNGTVCNDGDLCSVGDVCSGGQCVGTLPGVLQYCNFDGITIPDLSIATPYPSSILVAGQFSYLCSAKVTLDGISHENPEDIDVLLARSSGPNAIIMSDVGGSIDAEEVTLSLSDLFSTPLSAVEIHSGQFKPTNIGGADVFGPQAPAPTGGSALSVFRGTNPNGIWNLWVYADSPSPSSPDGSMLGWCVDVISVCAMDSECNDGNPCTNDACASARCTHTNNTVACNDGNACTIGDVCNNSSCSGSPAIPGDVGTLSATKSGATTSFTWSATACASRYDMLRGRVRDWPVGSNPATESCFDNLLVTTASDSGILAPGTGAWFLVRAENSDGNGSFGSQGSHGVPTVPRLSGTCP